MGDVIEGAREALAGKLDAEGEYFSGVGDEPTYRGPSTAQEVADLALDWSRQAVPGQTLRIATRTVDEGEGGTSYSEVVSVTGNGIEKAPTVSGGARKSTRSQLDPEVDGQEVSDRSPDPARPRADDKKLRPPVPSEPEPARAPDPATEDDGEPRSLVRRALARLGIAKPS